MAMRCDRCKRLVKPLDTRTIREAAESIVLCDTCYETFAKWLEEMPVDPDKLLCEIDDLFYDEIRMDIDVGLQGAIDNLYDWVAVKGGFEPKWSQYPHGAVAFAKKTGWTVNLEVN